MKFFETHFEEYIQTSQKNNLHSKFDKIFLKFPKNIIDIRNIIFYGPPGVGKYTQALKCIKKYSPTELKYEKKISIFFNKQTYIFKISDIHYEIDMSLLSCNSKLLWHEIYQQIIDIVSAKQVKVGFILCKNFHNIHNELLDNFYSYLQTNVNFPIGLDIKFIILTEQISFISDNILNCCKIISIGRPSKVAYSKISNQKIASSVLVENISNIKHLHSGISELMNPYKFICDKILNEMLNDDINYLYFRDILYDICIYNLDINDCIWYILTYLINKNKIKKSQMSKILVKTYTFLQYYNNNYRPIYHLESFFFNLIHIINEY